VRKNAYDAAYQNDESSTDTTAHGNITISHPASSRGPVRTVKNLLGTIVDATSTTLQDKLIGSSSSSRRPLPTSNSSANATITDGKYFMLSSDEPDFINAYPTTKGNKLSGIELSRNIQNSDREL
jgi:hypothetical protein